jgi:5'-nucleotidase
LAFVSAAFLAAGAVGSAQGGGTATVQLLAINDFHGNLEPPTSANGRIGDTLAGGAEYLATHLANGVAQNPDSIIVAAGDLVGATPLVSALFHDEPAIEALNAMKLSVASVGNHEFDHGWQELLRLQRGGCHPTDGCHGGETFAGAAFQYLSANVVQKKGEAWVPLFPATAVRTVGGVKIGFIGETLKGTPQIVTPTSIRGLRFLDEAPTANRYAAELQRQGVHAIVLLIHQGGSQRREGDPNGCDDFKGEIVPIVQRLSPDIKVVVSGHSHQFYNCMIAGHHVTSASSFGRMVTRLNLTVDRSKGTITNVAAVNEVVTRDVPKNPAQARLLAKYIPLAAPLANRVVGSARTDITRMATPAGESALGGLIADAQLAATRPAEKGGAVLAFMNPGGIRADLVGGTVAAGPRPVTYNDLFTIQPFGNVMTVVTMTGAGLKRVLEQQFDNPAPGMRRILQVSKGFTYRYAPGAPPGQRVDATSITLNGRAISPDQKVRVAVNNFLAAGGDSFSGFVQGTNRLGGDVDIDALVAYVRTHSPLEPDPRSRITRVE